AEGGGGPGGCGERAGATLVVVVPRPLRRAHCATRARGGVPAGPPACRRCALRRPPIGLARGLNTPHAPQRRHRCAADTHWLIGGYASGATASVSGRHSPRLRRRRAAGPFLLGPTQGEALLVTSLPPTSPTPGCVQPSAAQEA